MLRNFFRSGFRTLFRKGSYGWLNLFGLATGIACAGLIFLWVEDEMGYDQSYANKDVLYMVRTNQTYDGVTRTFSSSPVQLAQAMTAEIPGIVNACRVQRVQALCTYGEKGINEKGCYTDRSYFSMFRPVFIHGDSVSAFKNLNSIVITQKMAERFFGGNANPIGQTLRLDNRQDYLVSGVVKNVPANSTMQIDWLVPFDVYLAQRPNLLNWGSNSVNTYAQLSPAANPVQVNRRLYDFISSKKEGALAKPFLFGMNDWRLRDKFEGGVQTGGRIEYVKMFTTIAWIILLIACINFMNLATARSEKRAREVGVRKVIGAGRRALLLQFLGEAMLMSFLAVLAGLLIIYLALPAFNLLVEKQLTIGLTNPLHITAAAAIALICGVVAGSYPALYLSGFKPIQVLKGWKQKNGAATWIRKGLVITQFAVSIILIISTVIIYQQLQYVKNREIGYDRNNLVSIDAKGDIIKNYTAIRNDLLNTGEIANAGLNSFNTMYVGNNTSSFDWQGKDKTKNTLISIREISADMIPTLGLRFLGGRNFRQDIASDSSNIIISESLAKMMGSGTAVGKKIYNGNTAFSVVGVVNDFVYGDMYRQGDPIIYFADPASTRFLYVRIKPGADRSDALDAMQAVLKKYNPAYPFEYTFVDDQFNDQFKSEALAGKLSRVFAVLAIIISCLGLFALAAYMAERRTKEVGIRKVLGASVTGITALLSREFLYLVAIAALVSYPVAWLMMHKWLQSYAYRTSISWWIFIAAGIGAMLIALVTVSFQSVKAALSNPVKSLRTE